MSKNDRFQIPTKLLEKQRVMSAKNQEEAVPDYISIQQRRNDMKLKSRGCLVPQFGDLKLVESFKRMEAARKVMNTAMQIDGRRQEILLMTMADVAFKKKHLVHQLAEIETQYEKNLKTKEHHRLDTLCKIRDYILTAKEVQREVQKQEMLIRIGLMIETLMEELAIYEETLGHLAFQENNIKSKADTLLTKQNIMSGRRDSINAKMRNDLAECEELKKKLFRLNFKEGDNIHYRVNLINKLQDKDTRSMRAVLELEAKFAVMRRRAYLLKSENAWLAWFLDWVLFDIIGQESLAGITPDSSPQEKSQCIIEYYKNLKTILASFPAKFERHIDLIF